MLPDSPTGLYWSVRGHVVCSDHASQITNPQWAADGWAPLPQSSQGFHGRTYQCERCSPRQNPIQRPDEPKSVTLAEDAT